MKGVSRWVDGFEANGEGFLWAADVTAACLYRDRGIGHVMRKGKKRIFTREHAVTEAAPCSVAEEGEGNVEGVPSVRHGLYYLTQGSINH